MLNLLGLPVEASTHAAEIDHMIVLVHWLMLVLFVGWGAFFLFVLFRFRKGANPKAELHGRQGQDLEGPRSRRRRSSKSCCWCSTRFRRGPGASRRFRPRARRSSCASSPSSSRGTSTIPGPTASSAGPTSSWWRRTTRSASIARDPDAKDDITTINQLNLPVDRPVLVHLSSKDVIHSFGLYEMRVKQDAIPGMDIPVWFIPNRVGDYEITCSQLCGLGHFRMRGFMTIQTAADYQKWYDAQEKELQPAPATATAPTAP